MTTAKNSAEVSAGKGVEASGYVYVGADSAAAPTDANTALGQGWSDLGYINEDGLALTIETDSEDIKDWAGTIINTIVTERSEELTYSLLQTNATTFKEVYGEDNVNVDADTGEIVVNSKQYEAPFKKYCFDMIVGNRVERIYIPKGKVNEVGEMTFQSGEPIAYEFTVKAFPDQSGVTSKVFVSAPAQA